MVHENPQIGSDGESEEGSRHSDTAAAVSAQSASATSAASGGATGLSSSSGMGSGEGKVSFSGKKRLLRFQISNMITGIGFQERIWLHILVANDVPKEASFMQPYVSVPY